MKWRYKTKIKASHQQTLTKKLFFVPEYTAQSKDLRRLDDYSDYFNQQYLPRIMNEYQNPYKFKKTSKLGSMYAHWDHSSGTIPTISWAYVNYEQALYFIHMNIITSITQNQFARCLVHDLVNKYLALTENYFKVTVMPVVC